MSAPYNTIVVVVPALLPGGGWDSLLAVGEALGKRPAFVGAVWLVVVVVMLLQLACFGASCGACGNGLRPRGSSKYWNNITPSLTVPLLCVLWWGWERDDA